MKPVELHLGGPASTSSTTLEENSSPHSLEKQQEKRADPGFSYLLKQRAIERGDVGGQLLNMTTVVTNTPTEPPHSASSHPSMTSQFPSKNSSMNKSITRLLQHSILQLCNEHIGYTHKLQILGVLCMTVDDEQQELVVKVNNTLKRVGPANGKDGGMPHPYPPHGLPPGVQTLPHVPHLVNNLTSDLNIPTPHLHRDIFASQQQHLVGASSSPASNPLPLNMSGRKSHGRKGTNPTKVQQVVEENRAVSDEDEDEVEPLTIIPEAPETSTGQEALSPSTVSSSRPRTNPPPSGSAKRKPSHQFRVPQYPSPSGSPYMRPLSIEPINGAYNVMEQDRASSSYPSTSSAHKKPQGLSLPIYVGGTYSQENHDDNEPINLAAGSSASKFASSPTKNHMMNGGGHSREGSPHSGTDPKVSDRPGSSTSSGMQNSHHVKDEPEDDTESDYRDHLSSLEEYARANVAALFHGGGDILDAHNARMDGLHPALPPYPHMGMFMPRPGFGPPSTREDDGLTIKYTSTGPYTVGANGKDVSNSSRVKDIIMYDDQSPLSAQKGARIETDYIVDKLGLDGRKRRRRALEDLLTPEEIAEYLGQPERNGDFTFKCKYCSDEFDSITRYIHHTLAAHQAYICHQCGKSFTTKSSLLRHRPIHTGMRRFACSICKKTFYRKDKCKAHIRRHLGVEDKTHNNNNNVSVNNSTLDLSPNSSQLPLSNHSSPFAPSVSLPPLNLDINPPSNGSLPSNNSDGVPPSISPPAVNDNPPMFPTPVLAASPSPSKD